MPPLLAENLREDCMRRSWLGMIGGMAVVVALSIACGANAAAPAAPLVAKAKVPTFAQHAQDRATAILDTLQKDEDYAAAERGLGELFDLAVAWTPDDRPDALRQVDLALRMVRQLQRAPEEHRGDLLKFLRGNPNFAATLAVLIRPGEDARGAYGMLDRLREKRAEQVEKFATLGAAICVVHPRPFERHVNENTGKAIDPIDLFDYYAKNEGRMFFGVRNVPAELLVYVVDATGSIDELNWALNKYAGNKEVGRLFFDVKYDYEHYRNATPKQITLKGFTLPNILQYGGVCADQAYFAMEAGKAIGVPTAYASGASGDVSHAWVGFLQTNGRQGWWNFDTGRYEAYRGVRGNVLDPQTRKSTPDSYVSLLAELIGTKPVDRQNAVALTDAAARMIELEKGDAPAVAPPGDLQAGSVRKEARKIDTAGELALLELALRQSAGYAPAWFGVRDLAVANKLSLADKQRWADVLLKLGAKRYPDFTLAVLSPMIATIPDSKEQDRLWGNLFAMFQNRFDLAANIRMQEAAMWESQDQPDKAGLCYMDVIERYASAGPFVIDALKGADKVLVDSKRGDKVVMLYEQTWGRTKPPKEMAGQFMTQSNWYRVGKMYVKKLEESGDTARAGVVNAQLDKPVMAAQ
jgi:hypothetical protein